MKKVTQDAEVLLAQSRWQFFGRLFNALRSGGQRIIEASLQGAAEQQVEAVRGPGGEGLLPACPGCGSMERGDFRRNGYYLRRLATTEGLVQLRVPRLRCRCGKSVPVEHLGFGRRQRYSYDFQLAVVEQVGMRVALRAVAAFFARRDVPVSPASLGRMVQRLRLPALGPLPLSPCEISVDAMYVRLWDKELPQGWTSNTACVLLAINHDPRLAEKVLGIVFAPAETEEGYRSLADLLLSRGMQADAPLVVVSDGAQVIPAAFSRSFTNVRFQRCQWHLAKDVRDLAPAREKEAVSSAAWWVLRAPDQDEADHRLDTFIDRFHRRAPDSLAALERGFFDATLCLRQPVIQRTNGRAERYVRELRRHYRPREAFRDTNSAVRRISMWAPILNAPHTGFDWLANLFAAQVGFHSRLTAFPSPIHT